MIDDQLLKKLRDLSIEGVAERLGLSVLRHYSVCPFHADKHPSLHFNIRKNSCRCYACMDDSLGPIDLVMKMTGKSFREACVWLDDDGLSLTLPKREGTECQSKQDEGFRPERYERFFERPWLSPEARQFLFEERRLDPRVIGWCRLTSWRDKQGTHWLQIPYFDADWHLIGLQSRNLDYSKQAASAEGGRPNKFRFAMGCKPTIYNLPILKRLHEGDEVWIAEGPSDCWALLSSGKKALAIASATLLAPKDKELLSSLSSKLSLRWSMYPDKDAPGEKLYLQLREILPNIEHHQLPPGCKDFSDFYLQKRKETNHATP